MRGAGRAWSTDEWKQALVNGVVFSFADRHSHGTMILAGATEHVEVKEQVAGLEGSHL